MTIGSLYANRQDEDEERGNRGQVRELPKIPKERLDQFVSGPMTGKAVNAASIAFKTVKLKSKPPAGPRSPVGPGALAFVGRAVLGPQQFQRQTLAAQFDVHAGVVGFDGPAERRTATHQSTFE